MTPFHRAGVSRLGPFTWYDVASAEAVTGSGRPSDTFVSDNVTLPRLGAPRQVLGRPRRRGAPETRPLVRCEIVTTDRRPLGIAQDRPLGTGRPLPGP